MSATPRTDQRAVKPTWALWFGLGALLVIAAALAVLHLVSERTLAAADARLCEHEFVIEARESARLMEAFLVYNGFTDIRQLYAPERSDFEEPDFSGNGENVLYAAVLDAGGLVVLHTDPAQIGTHVDPAQVVPTQRVTEASMMFSGRARRVCDVMVPLHLDGRVQGALRMGFDDPHAVSGHPMIVAARGFRDQLLLLVGGLGILLALLAWGFVYLVGRVHARAVVSGKLAADRQLATIGAGIVHEVKNSLNGIVMNTQLLQQQVGRMDEQVRDKMAKKLDRIASEAGRAGTVMSEFLSFAKPSDYAPAPLNLVALLDDIAQFFEPECRQRRIELRMECDQHLTGVMADEQQLRHAVTNLLYNAIDAVDHDGRIDLCGVSAGHMVRISVRDTGGGLAPDSEPKVFDAFFSTKPGGAGLGLSIVQRVAQCHGGRVAIANEPGTGCTFTLVFPRETAVVP